jgi:hypothetical protein
MYVPPYMTLIVLVRPCFFFERNKRGLRPLLELDHVLDYVGLEMALNYSCILGKIGDGFEL